MVIKGFFLILSCIPVLILGTLMLSAFRKGNRIRTAFTGATAFHEIVFFAFPLWYSVFTNFELEKEMRFTDVPERLIYVVIGEVIFVSMFWLGMNWGSSKKISKKMIQTPEKELADSIYLYVLVIIGLILYIAEIVNAPTTIIRVIAHSEGIYYDSTTGMLISWFRGFFHFSSLVAAAIVLVTFTRKKHLVIKILSLIVLLLLICMAIYTGNRGRFTCLIPL